MPSSNDDKTPQLTIGMPVYNMASYVEEAVSSLLCQTFSCFRLVISDNASNDGTTEILKRIAEKDDRVTLIQQTKNIGVIANFRTVFDACDTPYFMWAAGDDFWEETWVEHLLPIATSNEAIAFGCVQSVDQTSTKLAHPANRRDLSFTGPRLIRRLKYYLDPGLLGRANPIHGIFRKDMLSKAAWNEFASGQHTPDVMCLYVMLRQVELRCDTSVVLCKRKHDKNLAVSDGPNARKPRFRRTQLPQFWRLSLWDERLGLILLYPVAAARVVLAKASYLTGRLREKRKR